MSAEQLGSLLRLWGITTAQLPGEDWTPDMLAPFLVSILQEAVPFADSVAPKSGHETTLWDRGNTKSQQDSAAPVTVYKRTVPSTVLNTIAGKTAPAALGTGKASIPPENWVCRLSVHVDAAQDGTSSWEEFHDSFKDKHPETEMAFTPTVVGARRACSWDCGSVEAEEGGETWGRFTLHVVEMRHKLGGPLTDRVFPVLQMTCAAMAAAGANGDGTNGAGADPNAIEPAPPRAVKDAAAVRVKEKAEFLVVSIPVTDFATSPKAHLSKEKSTLVAPYVSVERIRRKSGDVEWLMATASDARGNLPAWVQKMAVAGEIIKDVFLYMKWIAAQRPTAGRG